MVHWLVWFFWHLWHPWCGGLHVDHEPRLLGVALRLTLVSSKTMDSTEKCFQISWVQEIVPPTPSSKNPQDLLPLLTWMFFHMKLLKVLGSPWSKMCPITVSIQILGLDYSSKPFSFIPGMYITPSLCSCTPQTAGTFVKFPSSPLWWHQGGPVDNKHLAWEWQHGDHSCRLPNDYTNSPGTSLLRLVSGWKWVQEHTI